MIRYQVRLLSQVYPEKFKLYSIAASMVQVIRIREERQRITDLLEKASNELTDAVIETAESIIELARDAGPLWVQRSVDEKRLFLEKILSNRVLSGQTVRFDLQKPFQVLAQMKQAEEWRPHVPLCCAGTDRTRRKNRQTGHLSPGPPATCRWPNRSLRPIEAR